MVVPTSLNRLGTIFLSRKHHYLQFPPQRGKRWGIVERCFPPKFTDNTKQMPDGNLFRRNLIELKKRSK